MTPRSQALCAPRLQRWLARAGVLAAAALVGACATRPPEESAPAVTAPPPVVLPPAPLAQPEPAPVAVPLRSASATNARNYRQYGASHIYAQNTQRIFRGKLPPMLYAVGVLNVDIDALGQVQRVDWMRAPRHAPEVMAEIERLVRAAAPYPAPTRMGRVTWTDVWLWDRSGQFQLDTLTEGQLGQAEPPRPRAEPPRMRTEPQRVRPVAR